MASWADFCTGVSATDVLKPLLDMSAQAAEIMVHVALGPHRAAIRTATCRSRHIALRLGPDESIGQTFSGKPHPDHRHGNIQFTEAPNVLRAIDGTGIVIPPMPFCTGS